MGKHTAPGSIWAWPKRLVLAVMVIGLTGSSIGVVVARLERRHQAAPQGIALRSSPAPSASSPEPTATPTVEPSFPPTPSADQLSPSHGPLASVYSTIKTRNNVVFLTIDDGYVIDPRVADLLEQAKVPVTLFLVENAARAHLDFFKRLVRAGATVENHTVAHAQLTKMTAAGQERAICGAMDGFQEMFGRRPTLFRPPFGAFNQTTRAVVRSCGMSAVLTWSAIMNHGYIAEQDHVLNAGELILMHFRTDLFDNLTTILKECAKRHLTIARLEDYIPSLPAAGVSA